MDTATAQDQVRELRRKGCTPKAVAKALGLPITEVSRLIRLVAREDERAAPERPVTGCWVNPGWREGLDAPPDWPDGDAPEGVGGLVGVVVARAHRHGKLSVSGFLVDVYCLGVKDALGPRVIDDSERTAFLRSFFGGFDAQPLAVPIDMARELVWGGIAYARTLGFEPHRDFGLAAEHLGAWEPQGTVRFGRGGKPMYIQGPYDDASKVMRTLARTVGEGSYNFTIGAA